MTRDRFLRSVAPPARRRSRDVTPPPRRPGAFTWRPDSVSEAFSAWWWGAWRTVFALGLQVLALAISAWAGWCVGIFLMGGGR